MRVLALRLPGGRTFSVVARNLSERAPYVSAVTLNGRPLDGVLLRHADVMAGGELAFEMTDAK